MSRRHALCSALAIMLIACSPPVLEGEYELETIDGRPPPQAMYADGRGTEYQLVVSELRPLSRGKTQRLSRHQVVPQGKDAEGIDAFPETLDTFRRGDSVFFVLKVVRGTDTWTRSRDTIAGVIRADRLEVLEHTRLDSGSIAHHLVYKRR